MSWSCAWAASKDSYYGLKWSGQMIVLKPNFLCLCYDFHGRVAGLWVVSATSARHMRLCFSARSIPM